MQLKKLAAACLAATSLGAVGWAQAQSVTFSFDPDGAGAGAAIGGLSLFDLSPGNVLTVNGAPSPTGTLSTYYQANFGSFQDDNGTNLWSSGGATNITAVAGFTETLSSSSSALNGAGTQLSVTNNFTVNSGGFFKLCIGATSGDALAGTGFACGGSGILSGQIQFGTSSQTGLIPGSVDPVTGNFTPDFSGLPKFDGVGADNYSGTTTIESNGSAKITLLVDFIDSNYFPDLEVADTLVLALVNSSLLTPFGQVNPSALFSSDGIQNGNLAANIGTINGVSGPDFQVQADANGSFLRVPEPESLALVGLALGLMGVFARRRRTA